MKAWHLLTLLIAIAVAGAVFFRPTRSREPASPDAVEVPAQTATIDTESPLPPVVLPPPAALAVQAAPQAKAPAAPEVAAVQARPPHEVTSAELHDHYEIAFIGEYADAAWANTARGLATQRLKASLPPGSSLRSVDCRTSFCRIETSHADLAHYREFVDTAFFEPASSIWNAGSYSTLVEDTGGTLVVVSYLAREGQQLPKLD